MVECSAPEREQLSFLSLEEITERWGEDGLRERFAIELKRFSENERAFINSALELASFLHSDERRVREPYINHVLRVTLRILEDPEFADVDVVVAGILHDTVENHHDKLAQDDREEGFDPKAYEIEMLHVLALDVLQAMFNERVAHLVDVLTNPPLDPAMPRAVKHDLYRENVVAKLKVYPEARVIKTCDVLDNTADLELISTKKPSKAQSLAKKYEPMLSELAELIDQADTPLAGHTKQRLQECLRGSQECCHGILA